MVAVRTGLIISIQSDHYHCQFDHIALVLVIMITMIMIIIMRSLFEIDYHDNRDGDIEMR